MRLLLLNPVVYFFYIAVAAIPAYFMNRLLLKAIRPRESGWRLAIYFLTVLFLAFSYTALISFILFKWVWPLKTRF